MRATRGDIKCRRRLLADEDPLASVGSNTGCPNMFRLNLSLGHLDETFLANPVGVCTSPINRSAAAAELSGGRRRGGGGRRRPHRPQLLS